MRSPIVLGVKPDVADALGWEDGAQPAWADVIDAVDRGDLAYGMASPLTSHSGFATLVLAATALSGADTVLESADIEPVTGSLARFAGGQQLTSRSSGWLSRKFESDPTAVDAIFNSDSVIAQLRVDGEPLRTIVPSGISITSDYPLSLLPSATDAQADAYRTAVDYLTSDEVQQRIADQTHRRTTATPAEGAQQVLEAPFPARWDPVPTLLGPWWEAGLEA